MPVRAALLCWILPLLLLWAGDGQGYGQAGSAGLTLEQLPKEGILLKGWRFHPGDNPAWADPHLDESGWVSLDPGVNVGELLPLRQAQVGWFRLHLHAARPLTSQVLALLVTQQGASEIYLQGRLLHRLGVVSRDAAQEIIYNPNNSPLPFLMPAPGEVVVAVRYSFTQSNFRYILSDWMGTPVLLVRLQRMDDAVSELVIERSLVAFKEFGKVGYFLVLGLLHLVFFCSYPLRRTNLYFSLATLGNAFGYLAYYYSYFMPHQGVSAYVASSLGNLLEASFCQLLLLSVYGMARERVGRLFWAGLLLMLLCVRFGSYWLPIYVFYFIGDAIRVNWRSLGRGIPDARLGMISWAGYSLLIAGYYLFYFRLLPANQLMLDIFYNGAMVWVTGLFSLLLSRDYARTNRSLVQKLAEVQTLSEQMRAQEEERQHRLATENQRLEEQVAGRTQEISHQNALLARQADQLLEQDQVKSRLITNLTHEFRTPLSLIISPVEKLLADSALPTRFHSLLTVVNRNARQLLSLINQLLDLSKLDAGQMRVSVTRSPLVAFVEEIIALFRPSAETKGIVLGWTYQTAVEYGLIDTDKWTKILSNLLSNALKYTPQGGRVSVHLQVATHRAMITITDSGAGIEPGKLPHIFERFYQADDSITRRHEGTGIGLALVRELTDLLGGTVAVDSELGQGTTIWLTLPFGPAHPGEEGSQDGLVLEMVSEDGLAGREPLLSLGEETGGKPLVLVAEDNTDLRDFIRQELAAHYCVVTAENGLEAWNTVQRELPDVVVSDVMMPLMDGFSLTRLIKSDPVTNHIAVVLLTARTARENRLEGLGLGADDYVSKPFHTDELQLRLRNLLTRRQQLQQYFQRQLATADNGSQPGSSELFHRADAERCHPFLQKLYERIEARLDDSTFGVEELATEVGISRRTLHRKLTALLNLSPQEVVAGYRLRRAVDLLRDGRNVSETACLVGYESLSHFSTMFKAYYQKLPSEFVKK